MRLVGMTGLVLGLGACWQAQTNNPEEVYFAFYQALSAGKLDRALTFLSKDTLEVFRRMSGKTTWAIEAGTKDQSVVLKRIRVVEQIGPLRNVEVISREEGRAVLRITAGSCKQDGPCSVSQVTARMQQGRWVLQPELPRLRVEAPPRRD